MTDSSFCFPIRFDMRARIMCRKIDLSWVPQFLSCDNNARQFFDFLECGCTGLKENCRALDCERYVQPVSPNPEPIRRCASRVVLYRVSRKANLVLI